MGVRILLPQPTEGGAHSSSGLGHRPLKAEIEGSNPSCATNEAKEPGAAPRAAGLLAPSREGAMMEMTGKQALLEQLVAEGVQYVFGNPGTTEQPFMDLLQDYPQLQYVLALQEAVALGMADGYAWASGRPAFVQLHIAPGLGNAMGLLYNARRTGTPLGRLRRPAHAHRRRAGGDAGRRSGAHRRAADQVGGGGARRRRHPDRPAAGVQGGR